MLGTVETVSVLVITLIITFITLVFGELVPKRVAMVRPEKTAYRVASFINGLSKVTKPLVRLLSSTTNGVLRLMGIDPDEDNDIITEDEILIMIQEGNEQGTIHDAEVEFVSNLFEFTDMRVEDVMTHRTEIVGIPVDEEIRDVIEFMARTPHTRYPVYEGNMDKIVGIIHSRDLVALYQIKGKETDVPKIRDIMRAPYFVPESKLLVELFGTMKKTRNHIAIAVDEYGGTSGIVTIMDVIEEIVGDIEITVISDELIQEKENGELLIDGLTDMEDVIKTLELDLDDDKYDTLSGFIIDSLGYIPDGRQQPEITFGDYIFRVEQVDGALVRSVCIRKQDEHRMGS